MGLMKKETLTFDGVGTYVGEVKEGTRVPHGQGTFTYANGDKYVGEWRDAKYNGQGTLTYANGEKLVGEWRDSLVNGQATFTRSDGKTLTGLWKNSEFVK